MISSSLVSPRKLAANLRSSPVTGLTYDSVIEKNIYRLVREKSDKKSFQLTKHIIQLEQFPVKLSLIIINDTGIQQLLCLHNSQTFNFALQALQNSIPMQKKLQVFLL